MSLVRFSFFLWGDGSWVCDEDNTNRDVKTRAYYVDLAAKLGVSTR